MAGTQRLLPISTRRERIAEVASREPKLKLTTLAHHIDRTWLHEAWRQTRKDGAAGIDGVTALQYAEGLDDKLGELEDRVKAGRWRAPPVRRAYIPKDGGKERPLGIPTIEDKLLQRAFVMLLEPVFEADFLDVSYGFRPGRSAHDALKRLRNGLWQMGGGWVLDVDLRSFFDTVDHRILRELVSERVGDGVVLRMLGKWLNAGVLEDGVVHRPGRGTPQGGVISPLLANVYLHHAVDTWFADAVVPRMRGSSFMVRYADDFVMAFSELSDAERVLDVLSKRLARFGLELNTEKTRLVYFGRPGRDGRDPETFDFLGFTLHWGKSREGKQIIQWRTSRKRLNRTLRAFNEWLGRHRHWPVEQQQRAINRRLQGHYAYFGLSLNMRALKQVFRRVVRLWRLWLNRRSQRGRMPWARFNELLRRHPLATPRIVHRLF